MVIFAGDHPQVKQPPDAAENLTYISHNLETVS